MFVSREKNKYSGLDTFIFADKKGQRYTIAVAPDGGIAHFHSSGSLLKQSYLGSAAIGVFVFSLPTLLLWLPFILLVNLYFMVEEWLLQRSRYASRILWKVRSSMPKTDYKDLKMVFQNDWNKDAY